MTQKEQHFKSIYKQAKDKIYRLCLGFTGNTEDADDLFQEVIIKVWNNLESFREESSINTWMYRITTNTALLYIKKRNKLKITSNALTENLEADVVQDDWANQEIKINRLYKAISTLKEMDRIIIGLLLEQNSYAEISKITGISTSNVGVRINRIKKSLAKKCTSDG